MSLSNHELLSLAYCQFINSCCNEIAAIDNISKIEQAHENDYGCWWIDTSVGLYECNLSNIESGRLTLDYTREDQEYGLSIVTTSLFIALIEIAKTVYGDKKYIYLDEISAFMPGQQVTSLKPALLKRVNILSNNVRQQLYTNLSQLVYNSDHVWIEVLDVALLPMFETHRINETEHGTVWSFYATIEDDIYVLEALINDYALQNKLARARMYVNDCKPSEPLTHETKSSLSIGASLIYMDLVLTLMDLKETVNSYIKTDLEARTLNQYCHLIEKNFNNARIKY